MAHEVWHDRQARNVKLESAHRAPQICEGADQLIREQIGTTAIGVVKLNRRSPLAVKVIGGMLTAKGAAMAKEEQYKLFEALKAHVADLEAERDRAFGQNQGVLDRRLETAVRVLEWLSTTLELGSSNTADLKRCSRTGSHSNRIASDPSHAFDILLSNISM